MTPSLDAGGVIEILVQPRAHIIQIGTFTKECWPLLWTFCDHYGVIETDDGGAPTKVFGWTPDELRDFWFYIRRN